MADQAEKTTERDYFVYEVQDPEGMRPMLAFVATVTASNEKQARWLAIDSDDSLKARATSSDGSMPEGVYLVAISARAVGNAVLTREEPVQRRVRR